MPDATVEGGDGSDTITGGYGSASVDAGDGDDLVVMSVGGPSSLVTLGKGADVLDLKGSFYFYYPGAEPLQVADFSSKDRLGLHELLRENYYDEIKNPFNDGHLRLAQVGADTILQGVAGSGAWVSLAELQGVAAARLTSGQLDGYRTGPVWLTGAETDDHLKLRKGFSHADGGAGDDVIRGSDLADTLIGGLGADTLSGRGGKDVFDYVSVQDSTLAAHDLIIDLADGDVIDLSRIDADTSTYQDDAFHLVDAFTGQAGELTLSYDKTADQTTISGDVDGDGVADLVIVADRDDRGFSHFIL